MAIKSDFGTALDSDFRSSLNGNFKKIDQRLDSLNGNFKEIYQRLDDGHTNIDGKTFPTVNDRLNAIEWGLKALGVPIDGSAKDWLGE